MAIVRNVYRDSHEIPHQEFICDTTADVKSLPTNCPAGSKATVVADSSKWMINSEGVWIRQIDSSGSGGGGNVGDGVAYDQVKVEVEETFSEEYAKSYQISQGGIEIATINIPKDKVVESGQLVENPGNKDAGTYLELTLANDDETKIYIPVSKLIDVYTAQQSATKIQLNITDHVISASIVSGSIGTEDLTEQINEQLTSFTSHVGDSIASENGSHNLRYFGGALQYFDGDEWKPISIADLLI